VHTNYYNKEEAIIQMNEWGAKSVPFLFIVDYDCKRIQLYKMDEIPKHVHYNINGKRNFAPTEPDFPCPLTHGQIDKLAYARAFDQLMIEIKKGNSYLSNLSVEVPIEIDLNLSELRLHINSDYALHLENEFLVFSPEPFVRIENGVISTCPMKGTIDASIPNAKEKLLADKKESAEHATVVDLLRNDLSMVGTSVRVEDYRYIEKIETNKKLLLATSSKITGQLDKDYKKEIGRLLMTLLPAGSVTGAPKKKTIEIINAVESHKRNYYTGVFGYFDGINMESAVMIRFIEQRGKTLYYKTGGGITHLSNMESEYQELLDKIYVPIYRKHKDQRSESIQSELA